MLYRKLLAAIVLILLSIQISYAQKLPGLISASADSTKLNYLSPGMISITDSIVNYGKIFLNTPYHHGSEGSTSFDCSGFTSFVYRNFGYNLGRSSDEQANQFQAINRDQLKEGDLVYFSGRRRSHRVGHVGIVVSAKEGNFNFIHASVHDGVIISNSDEDYYKRRYIMANRVINNNQFLAVNTHKKQTITDNIFATQTKTVSQLTKKVIPAEYHRVKSGETLSSIANKFGLTVAELKSKNNLKGSKINPKQKLKVKDQEIYSVAEPVQLADNKPVQTISQPTSVNSLPVTEPVKAENVVSNASFGSLITHLVQKGETLFSISNLYHTTIEQIKKWNNIDRNTILPGQSLKIDQATETVKPEPTTPSTTNTTPVATPALKKTHKVQSGETLFDIAKDNNITVDDLKSINNLTSTKLHPGQELIITKPTDDLNNDKSQSQPVISKTEKTEKQNTPDKSPSILRYKVKSGDSFYSIAKKNDCSVAELKKWNNKSGSKIKPGEKLVIYSSNN
jgi:LysM repeat protein